ncbi:MAG: HDOD domain-containing protein [Chromatiaceae bacterium]|nr:HDOD domain-containing protein [Chromatiaceae bacterium]
MLEAAEPELLQQQCQQLAECLSGYNCRLLLSVSLPLVLARQSLAPLPASKVMLAIAGQFEDSAALRAALGHYKSQGFGLVVDDSPVGDVSEELLALANIIRIDMTRTALEDVQRHKALYEREGLTWLATRVETEAQFTLVKTLGCQWFQGYFLPDKLTVAGKTLEPSALKLAEIISCLFVDEPDINKLVALLADEPAIVMGLLKLANSPLYRKTRAVNSVKEVVTRLGLTLARKWLLSYAVLSGTNPAAAIMILARAHTMARIAGHWQVSVETQQQYFLAGIISGTDRLFGIDSNAFLRRLHVSKGIKQALQHQSGQVAQALELVMQLEQSCALGQGLEPHCQPYLPLYQDELAQVQQRLAQAGC